jgi:hypothetical protein
LTREQDAACLDSIRRMEATGSPIISDGEQRASSFATYPLADTLAGTGLADNLAGDGQYFAIFTDGHHRQLPRLTGGAVSLQDVRRPLSRQGNSVIVQTLQAGGDRTVDVVAAAQRHCS